MDDFKEFQGSDLDNAIKSACSYYNATREKLEIDIIQDSKTGIFGLVGARKAKIKARKVQLRSAVADILGNDKINESQARRQADLSDKEGTPSSSDMQNASTSSKDKDVSEAKKQSDSKPNNSKPKHATASAKADDIVDANAEDEMASYGPGNALGKNNAPHGRANNDTYRAKNSQNGKNIPSSKGTGSDKNLNDAYEENFEDILEDDVVSTELTLIPFETLDQEKLKALCFEAVKKLTFPIVGEVPIYVEIKEARINVVLDCGDDSGLLIGREGQTLASIQYLASRVVSRQMQAAIRIQLDAGEYKLRQDEKLKSIALSLAERVKSTGRSCSTRPLSSYHRRIVHMALQESLEVQTRSSGEGALKRVIIQRKRG